MRPRVIYGDRWALSFHPSLFLWWPTVYHLDGARSVWWLWFEWVVADPEWS
jgi:hypothetical protein